VVITGVGAITPLGCGAAALHDGWTGGRVGVRDGVAACDDFDAGDYMTVKDARRADRFTQLAVAAAAEAVADAGWAEGPPYPPERLGCVFGTGIGGLATIEANHSRLGNNEVSPLAIPLMMPNAAAAALAMRHGLRGPVYGVVSACAAGAHAIGTAARTIASKEATAVVTGGSEAPLSPLARAAFAALDATSQCGVSRPFDARRDGFVMGEGAAALVVEDGAAARARGARILAQVRGYGATCDAFHLTAPDALGSGQAQAIEAALADAGLQAQDIDYVNAHGTSTPLNDRTETLALKRALGERAHEVPVSSTKSAIGHLLGAAGAVEAVATVLALRARVAPPTLGFAERDPDLDLDYVAGEARVLKVDPQRRPVALSNSFGFGGHNAVLCLEAG
jgi:3-oxoacyl-[acyl-carrier-protein] synthase II